jgi:conserved oligomeric Golgi complex subunit 6
LQPPEPNLSIPIPVINSIQNLRELMTVYEISLLGGEDEDQKVEDFRRILSASIDPSLEACRKMVELNSSKDAAKDDWANQVFLLNCFSYIQVRALLCSRFSS